MQPKYRVTPSLLNSFQEFIDAERLWEKVYGASDDPAFTLAEFEQRQEQKLLDAINRVETEPAEAPTRGTCLNEIIDCILEHRQPHGGISVQSVRDPDGRLQHITASLDGFTFNFDANLCLTLAGYFRGCECQYYCEAILDTSFGPVIMYGYPDYIRKDVVYDLKTTGRYEWGKYENGWQKVVYPWCLIESGEMKSVSGFEYTAVKIYGGNTKSPLIGGEIYHEWYDYNHDRAGRQLRETTEAFLSWVEQHRSQITHQRIFNK